MDQLFMAQSQQNTKNTLETQFCTIWQFSLIQMHNLILGTSLPPLKKSVLKLSCGDTILFYLTRRIPLEYSDLWLADTVTSC